MRTTVSIAVVLALAVLALGAMRRGWLHRRDRSSAWVPDLPATPPEGAGPGTLGARRTEPFEATYVSSTRSGDWLERVVAHDLGARSAAVVQVFDAGARIARTGALDVFVPATSLRSVGATGGIAGKFMGRDAIVVLTWVTGPGDERGLDTGLHLRHDADRPRLIDAATALIVEPAPIVETALPAERSATKETS
jgi:hypothetical protein